MRTLLPLEICANVSIISLIDRLVPLLGLFSIIFDYFSMTFEEPYNILDKPRRVAIGTLVFRLTAARALLPFVSVHLVPRLEHLLLRTGPWSGLTFHSHLHIIHIPWGWWSKNHRVI